MHGLDKGRYWFDRLWLILAAGSMLVLIVYIKNGQICNYLATDFRGYYAFSKTVRETGVESIYEPLIQFKQQKALPLICPPGKETPALMMVLVPYLPVFTPVLFPLSYINFTNSYILWSVINLVILFFYLRRFGIGITGGASYIKLLQWMISFPVMANLALGQINVLVVIFLGEFICAYLLGKPLVGGAWLGGMLLKPHTLILLLPGLLISRRWKFLLAFCVVFVLLFGISFLIAGVDGMQSWARVVMSFSAPSFMSVPNMMNGRGLAFNLSHVLPGWLAWFSAVFLMIVTIVIVIGLWARYHQKDNILWLMLATVAGTLIVSWHSNLYMGMLILPILYVLDLKRLVPSTLIFFWVIGPLVIYGISYLITPEFAHSVLGMSLLIFNCFLVGWAAWRLLRSTTVAQVKVSSERFSC